MIRKLTALLLLLATFSITHAETFTVTTNSVSGPGSLGEALLKAAENGTAETDFILFDLPGTTASDKTITLSGALPPLTSHLILDGTSQQGSSFGRSDTKVILKRGQSGGGLSMQDATDIEIYGIWFTGFDWIMNLSDFGHGGSIFMNGVSNITIGKTGKGNAFSNNNRQDIGHKSYYGIDYTHPNVDANNILIQANIFGLNASADGIDKTLISGISLGNSRNLVIDHNNGNGMFEVGSAHEEENGFIKFTNNNLANPFSATEFGYGYLAVALQGLTARYIKYDLTILNNKITNSYQDCIILWDLRGNVQIEDNTLGAFYDETNTEPDRYGMFLIRCKTERPIRIMHNEIQNRREGISLAGCGRAFISENRIFCNKKGIAIVAPDVPVPVVSLKSITTSQIKGQTTPHSKVELFRTESCTDFCENGKTFLGTTLSGADGSFSFPVSGDGLYSATATTQDSSTSEFNGVKINTAQVVVKNTSCALNNGSITGIKILNAASWYWENETGQTVSKDTNLVNVSEGKYRMVLHELNVSCPVITPYYEIGSNPKPTAPVSAFAVTQPACAAGGKITFTGTLPVGISFKWFNKSGSYTTYYADHIANLAPDTYYCKLYVYDDSLCNTVYGPFVIAGAHALSIDSSTIKITNTTCGASNGSIQNIKTSNITGNPGFIWLDADDHVVGTALDLKNIPGGTYRMMVYDDSHCNITTAPIVVGGSSKTEIDSSNAAITSSQCGYGSGTIKGITVTGAADFIWTNEKGVVMSRDLDATGLLPGTYTLTAGTATGCPKTSPALTVPVDPDMQLDPALQTTVTPATCAQPNGSVVLQNFPAVSYTLTWKQTDAVPVATTKDLKKAAGGTYTLYATDAAGCTQRVTTATIPTITPPHLQTSAVQTHNDVCTQNVGSIQGFFTEGGTRPFTYQWLNGQQQVATTLNLVNRGAGTYQLTVKDASGCTMQSAPFTLINETKTMYAPHYPAQLIPRHTSTTLTPQNTQTGTYEWFDDAALQQKRDENRTGVFQTPNLPDDKTYCIRIREGSCISPVATVTIKVADDAKVYVPTAFTPNRDGKNDDIKPLVIGIFKLEHFAIYDRWGHLVFKSNDLTKGWNGYNKGLEAPIGAYVWLLKGADYKGNVIQQRGTVLLVR